MVTAPQAPPMRRLLRLLEFDLIDKNSIGDQEEKFLEYVLGQADNALQNPMKKGVFPEGKDIIEKIYDSFENSSEAYQKLKQITKKKGMEAAFDKFLRTEHYDIQQM